MAIALAWTTGNVGDGTVAITPPVAGQILCVGMASRDGSAVVPAGWLGQRATGVIGTPFVTAWRVATGLEGATFGLAAWGFGGTSLIGALSCFSGFPAPARVGTGNKQSNQPPADPAICAALTPPTPNEVLLFCSFGTDDSFESVLPTVVGGGFTQLANGVQPAGEPWFVNGYRIVAAPAGAFAMQVHHRNSDGWGSGIEGIYAGVAAGKAFPRGYW